MSFPAAQPESSRGPFALDARGAAPKEAPFRLPASAGEPVDARRSVEPGTALALTGANVGAVLVGVLLLVSIYGGVVALAAGIAGIFLRRRARVLLCASSLRVGPRQFAEIHACAAGFARRLGLREMPEVYVIDRAEVNGFAQRCGGRDVLVLTDDAVAACLEGGSPGALAFVIAHELAHVALGHHRVWRSLLRRMRKLSRLDEQTADNVACELVGSREAAEDGVLLLGTGPRLLALADRGAARMQAAEVVADRATAKAERMLTHPTVLRRLERVQRRFEGERAAA